MCGTDRAYGASRAAIARQRVVLPAYELATPCLVLSQRICLRSCYEMSGTKPAYGASRVWGREQHDTQALTCHVVCKVRKNTRAE
eukprot:365168-Rhodomonas_salina.1